MNKKKEFEHFYLKKFVELLGEKPKDVEDRETPDFIVKLHQTKIGVEVMEFHSGSKREKGWTRRAIEEAWASLQRTIMEQVERCKGLENMYGFLSFKKLELPARSENRQFVIEFIKQSLEMVKSDCNKIKPEPNYPLLNKYLAKFYLEKTRCYYISWEWNHNITSVGLTEIDLISAVKPKIEKAATYKQKDIGELWLLIVSGYRLSQEMGRLLSYKLNAFDQLNRLLKQSGYDKVYIYQYMIDGIYEWPGWVKIGKENLIPTINR